jgi:hypothetical protein
MEVELSSIDSRKRNVHFVVRRFRPTCPTCGPFLRERVGYHGSITKKQMLHLFPKREQRRLRDALPEEERQPFTRTMAGKREPKDEDVGRWIETRDAIRRNNEVDE